MSEPHKKKRSRNRLKSGLKAVFYSFTSSFNGMAGVLTKLLGIGGPSRRRNNNFEKSGKEFPVLPDADSSSIASLDKATKIRNEEIIRAVKTENRLLRKRGEVGKQFRKEKESENREVSRGDVISHLARMQRKASQEENKLTDIPDDEQQES